MGGGIHPSSETHQLPSFSTEVAAMALIRPFRLLLAAVVATLFVTACSSGSAEVDDTSPAVETTGPKSLSDFETLSEKNRDDYADDTLGDKRVADYPDDVLVLYGVDEITDGEAAELAQYQGGAIFFVDLVELTPEAAAALAGWGGDGARLEFVGLERLEPTAAAALVGWRGERMGLDGIRRLEFETARAIGEWYVDTLALNGLTELDAEIASELIRAPQSTLELHGLESIDAEAAKALASWRGEVIGLTALTEMDDEAEEALREFQGTIQWHPKFDASPASGHN